MSVSKKVLTAIAAALLTLTPYVAGRQPAGQKLEEGIVGKGAKAFVEWLRSSQKSAEDAEAKALSDSAAKLSDSAVEELRDAAAQHVLEECAIRGAETATARTFGEVAAETVRKVAWGPKAKAFRAPDNQMVYRELDLANQQRGFLQQQRLSLIGDYLEVQPMFGFETATMSMPKLRGVFSDAAVKVMLWKPSPSSVLVR